MLSILKPSLLSPPIQELLSEALAEERQRSEAAIARAVDAAQQKVEERMQDVAKVSLLLQRSDYCTLCITQIHI